MEKAILIDFAELTDGGRVSNLSGRNRGLAARERFALDWTNNQDATEMTVLIPENLDSITPSFIQGMFGNALSALNCDEDKFFQYFHFEAPAFIIDQVKTGLTALRTSRDLRDLL